MRSAETPCINDDAAENMHTSVGAIVESFAHPERSNKDFLSGRWNQDHVVLRRCGLEHLRRRHRRPACGQQISSIIWSRHHRAINISQEMYAHRPAHIHKSSEPDGCRRGFLCKVNLGLPSNPIESTERTAGRDGHPEGTPACLLKFTFSKCMHTSQPRAYIHKSVSATGYKPDVLVKS